MGFNIENGVLVKYTEEPGVTEVVVPVGVTGIGDHAFSDCTAIKSAVIPNSVIKIGDGAFERCLSLRNVVIPDSVKEIGEHAFRNCCMPKIHMDSLKQYMGLQIGTPHWLFIAGEQVSDVVIPEGTTRIGAHAFSDCSGLRKVIIPEGVTSIEDFAFASCRSLRNVFIPESTAEIGRLAFFDCDNPAIHMEDPEQYMSLRLDTPHRLFIAGKEYCDLAVPGGTTGIGDYAFAYCTSLINAEIPDSVTKIGTWAFCGCTGLKTAVIPDGVTDIGGYAFSGCTGLKSLAIPDSAANIGPEAFHGCTGLETVRVSLRKLCELKKPRLWKAYKIPYDDEFELRSFCTALSQCPKRIRPKLEDRLMYGLMHAAVAEHFEKYGRLEEYASIHHTDANTLRDTMLSDYGLDPSGCRSWVLAGKTYTVQLQPNLNFTLRDEGGKTLRSLPKKGAEPEEYNTVKTEFARLKKDIRVAAKLRADRLFTEFQQKTAYTAQRWKRTYLVNPLLKILAKLVVWQQSAVTFILDAQGVPSDVNGNPTELTDEPIILAHPMELDAQTLKAWRDYLTDRQIRQPFEQMWEPVLDGSTIEPDRYEDCEIPAYMLINKARHGITVKHRHLELADCSASLIWTDTDRRGVELYEIRNFRFLTFNRQVNHILSIFDRCTVSARILKDDASVQQHLGMFTLPQILEFIDLAVQNNCPNVSAVLQQYKQEHFPDADPMDAFTLDLL